MRIREWFGWEALLGFSMYGSTLRVLPIQGVYVWAGILTVFGIAILWFFLSAVKYGIKISRRIAIFSSVFAALFLWCIFTLFWSPISISQLVVGDFYILANVLIPTVALAISNTENIVLGRRWIVGVVLAIFITSCYSLFLWIISPGSLYATLLDNAVDDASLGGIYLAVGQALMAFAIVSFIWGVYSLVWRKTAFIISAMAFWLAMDSGARGPIVWGFLTLLIFSLINFSHKKTSVNYRFILIFFLLLIAIIIWSIFLNFDFLANHLPFLNRFNSDSDRGYDELSSIGMRLNYYRQAIDQFFEQPFFGQGVLSFRSLSNLGSVYPHNIFLDALGDLGLVGFFLSIFLVSCGLVACWHITVTGDRIVQKISAALFVYFLGMEMSSGYLYWSWVWPWAIIVIQVQPQILMNRSQHKVQAQTVLVRTSENTKWPND